MSPESQQVMTASYYLPGALSRTATCPIPDHESSQVRSAQSGSSGTVDTSADELIATAALHNALAGITGSVLICFPKS